MLLLDITVVKSYDFRFCNSESKALFDVVKVRCSSNVEDGMVEKLCHYLC